VGHTGASTVNIRFIALQLYSTLPYIWEDRDRRYSRTRSEYYRIVTRHTVRLRGIEIPGLRRYREGAPAGAHNRGPTVVAPIDVDPSVAPTTIVVALLLPPPWSSRRCRLHNLCAAALAPTSIGRTDVCRQRRILECEVPIAARGACGVVPLVFPRLLFRGFEAPRGVEWFYAYTSLPSGSLFRCTVLGK